MTRAPGRCDAASLLRCLCQLHQGPFAVPTHADTPTHPTTAPRPRQSSADESPPPSSVSNSAIQRAADPQPASPKAARGTFGLGVVHCKHVDCHKLEHAGASDGRGAVLQQDLELPQDLLGHRRESLHPADRERVCRAQAVPPGRRAVSWHSSFSVTSPGEGGPPGVPSPVGNEGAGCDRGS